MRTKQYIKEINNYVSKLTKENQEKFEFILLKIRFSRINDHDAEEFSHHCLDLFLTAEDKNIPVEDLLGNKDLEDFCNEFINETLKGYSWWEKLYWKINTLPLILLIYTGIYEMFIGYLLKSWIDNKFTFTIPVTLSMVANTIIILLLIHFLLNKVSYYYKATANNKKKDRLITFFMFLGFCFLIILFIVSKLALKVVLFKLNFLLFMGILGLICTLQHFLENRKK